jgi:phage repressor protein C with HTH and peptisase S24 domain
MEPRRSVRRYAYMAKQPTKPATNRVAELRKSKKLTQSELGDAMDGVHWTTISDLERGKQRLTVDWINRIATALEVRPSDLLLEEAPLPTQVPLDGLVGAGGIVENDYSPLYHGDVTHIELDIPLPSDIRAFEVWGDSMLPKYDPGDVILVRGAAVPAETVIGTIALVITEDNGRFLKRVLKGSRPGLYDLESFNARTMKDQLCRRPWKRGQAKDHPAETRVAGSSGARARPLSFFRPAGGRLRLRTWLSTVREGALRYQG